MAKTGQDWNFVRNQLGHFSIEVTQVYVHVIRTEARKALARLYARRQDTRGATHE